MKALNIRWIIILLFFLLAGTSLLFGGWQTLQTERDYNDNGIKLAAHIDNIETEQKYYGNKHTYTHHVFVSFEVNGEHYNGELNYYDSSMKVGGAAEIYYMPDNPSHFIYAKDGEIQSKKLIYAGILCETIFVALIILRIKISKLNGT